MAHSSFHSKTATELYWYEECVPAMDTGNDVLIGGPGGKLRYLHRENESISHITAFTGIFNDQKIVCGIEVQYTNSEVDMVGCRSPEFTSHRLSSLLLKNEMRIGRNVGNTRVGWFEIWVSNDERWSAGQWEKRHISRIIVPGRSLTGLLAGADDTMLYSIAPIVSKKISNCVYYDVKYPSATIDCSLFSNLRLKSLRTISINNQTDEKQQQPVKFREIVKTTHMIADKTVQHIIKHLGKDVELAQYIYMDQNPGECEVKLKFMDGKDCNKKIDYEQRVETQEYNCTLNVAPRTKVVATYQQRQWNLLNEAYQAKICVTFEDGTETILEVGGIATGILAGGIEVDIETKQFSQNTK